MENISPSEGSGPTVVSGHQLQEFCYFRKISLSAQSAPSLGVWGDAWGEKSQDRCWLNQRLIYLQPEEEDGEWIWWGGSDKSVIWPLWTAAIWKDFWTLWTTHSLMDKCWKRYTEQDVIREEGRITHAPLVWPGPSSESGVQPSLPFIWSSQGYFRCYLLSLSLCGQHLWPQGFPPTAGAPTDLLKRLPWTE